MWVAVKISLFANGVSEKRWTMHVAAQSPWPWPLPLSMVSRLAAGMEVCARMDTLQAWNSGHARRSRLSLYRNPTHRITVIFIFHKCSSLVMVLSNQVPVQVVTIPQADALLKLAGLWNVETP